MAVNPFKKNAVKQQQDMIEQEYGMTMDQNVVGNAMQPHDEQVMLEQKSETENLTRWQQDLDPDIERMVHDLRMEYFNGERERWERQKDINGEPIRPLCNELLIRKMVALLRPNTSRNLIMSNYTDSIIQDELRSLYISFIMHLGFNRVLYDVEKGDMSMILRLFKSVAKPTFYRALNAGERNSLKTIYKHIDTNTSRPNKKKGGWDLFN